MALPIVKEILLDKIDISFFNMRTTNRDIDIAELAESIRKIGLQQPIVVSEKSKGRFDLISGQRRYSAYRLLYKEKKDPKWSCIPAIVIKVKSETDAIIKSFSENIHRLELSAEDKMQIAGALMDKLGDVELVAKHLGVSVRKVRSWLGLAGVYKPLREMVDENKISQRDAKRITQVADDVERAKEIAEGVSAITEVKGRDKREVKRAVIDQAKQSVKTPVKVIVEEVKKKPPRKITVELTERVSEALKRASDTYDRDEKELALVGIEEWLKKEEFMK